MTFNCELVDYVQAGEISAEICHVTGTPCLPATAGGSSRHCVRRAWYLDQEKTIRRAYYRSGSGPDQGGVLPVSRHGQRGIRRDPTKADQPSQH